MNEFQPTRPSWSTHQADPHATADLVRAGLRKAVG